MIDFNNKKILIIGSASEAAEELEAINIKEIDLVVRMNNSINVPIVMGDNHFFKRIDILSCSSYKESNFINFFSLEQLKNCSVKAILLTPFIKLNNPISFRLKEMGISVLAFPDSLYSEALKKMSGFIPTTGFATLYYLLKTNFKELHIIGFTFLKTGYLKGYNSIVNKSIEFYIKKNHHNPEIEMTILREIINSSNNKIFLGKHTSKELFNKN